MDGIELEWRVRNEPRLGGKLIIPSLTRNMKGWRGMFAWEVEGAEWESGAVVRVLDSERTTVQAAWVNGAFGYWNRYDDTWNEEGSLPELLSTGARNYFTRGWAAAYFEGRPGELTADAITVRIALGEQL